MSNGGIRVGQRSGGVGSRGGSGESVVTEPVTPLGDPLALITIVTVAVSRSRRSQAFVVMVRDQADLSRRETFFLFQPNTHLPSQPCEYLTATDER